jgi:hypothetical protein
MKINKIDVKISRIYWKLGFQTIKITTCLLKTYVKNEKVPNEKLGNQFPFETH